MISTIVGGTWSVHRKTRRGPYYHGGNIYVVSTTAVSTGNNQAHMRRSTDGGSTWATVGTGPGDVYDLEYVDSVQLSNRIYVIYWWYDGTAQGFTVHPFNMDTNAWEARTPRGPALQSAADITGYWPHSITVRGHNNYVVFYQGPTYSSMGTSYRRPYFVTYSTAGWAAQVDATTGSKDTTHIDVRAAIRVSDETWLFYTKVSGGLYYVRLTDTGSLGVETLVASDSAHTYNYAAGEGRAYTDGTVTRVVLPYPDGGINMKIARTTKVASPTWTLETVSDSGNTTNASGSNVGTVTASGTKLYQFWPRSTDYDLIYDKNEGTGWGVDSVEFVGTVTGISSGLLGTDIGVVWEDGGAIRFGKITLAVATKTNGFKYWDGTQYNVKPLKYWDGTTWQTKPLKRWSGTAWVNVEY